jgi:hypothetical protein
VLEPSSALRGPLWWREFRSGVKQGSSISAKAGGGGASCVRDVRGDATSFVRPAGIVFLPFVDVPRRRGP